MKEWVVWPWIVEIQSDYDYGLKQKSRLRK